MLIPAFCPVLPWSEPSFAVTAPQDGVKTQAIDSELVVSSKTSSFDPVTKTYTFRDGVTATYGLTTITADHLEIHMGDAEQWAHAAGMVHVLDPDADLQAAELEFSWTKLDRWAKAKQVSIAIGHVRVKAASADLKAQLWTFDDVELTNAPQYFWITSKRIVLVPGSRGKLENPTLHLFGRRLLSLPDRSFNLDPRTQGISIPAISYRKGQGLGVSWEAGTLLDDRTNLYVSASAFPKAYPGMGFTASRSFVSAEKASAIITPTSELSERFRFGYLDNIEVRRPTDEARVLRTPRNSISIDSLWNQGVGARDYDTFVSKAIEAVYESGGPIGSAKPTGFAYLAQARVQTIRERGGPWATRGVLIGSLEAPSVRLGHSLSTLARLDGTQFLSNRPFGWSRGLVGLSFEPSKMVRLSAGAYGSIQYGTAQFQFDRLIGEHGVELRGDFDFGSTRVSYLQKFDTKLRWYDREYLISQVAGAFEPYMLYRKFPQTYTLGIRFRIDDLVDIVSSRKFPRTDRRTTISAPSGAKG